MENQPALPPGYEIREMSGEEMGPLWREHSPRIFDDNSQVFHVHEALSEEERASAKELRGHMGAPLQLRLGLFHEGSFAGWSLGSQESFETFYMRNSAVLPEHRRKGLYTILMRRMMELAAAKGFQKIYSRHNATNNPVIIPKLKAGFVISGMEVSDAFGLLVHLAYFTNPLRRKMMVYRVGDMRPDEEIRRHLEL